jgi:hypothetical protein
VQNNWFINPLMDLASLTYKDASSEGRHVHANTHGLREFIHNLLEKNYK